jgi:hypothetical protein
MLIHTQLNELTVRRATSGIWRKFEGGLYNNNWDHVTVVVSTIAPLSAISLIIYAIIDRLTDGVAIVCVSLNTERN